MILALVIQENMLNCILRISWIQNNIYSHTWWNFRKLQFQQGMTGIHMCIIKSLSHNFLLNTGIGGPIKRPGENPWQQELPLFHKTVSWTHQKACITESPDEVGILLTEAFLFHVNLILQVTLQHIHSGSFPSTDKTPKYRN